MSDNRHSVKQHGSVEKDPRTGEPACVCSRPSKTLTWPGRSSSASIYPRVRPQSNLRQAPSRSGPRPTSTTKSNKPGRSIRRHPTQTALDGPRATRSTPTPVPGAPPAVAAGEYVHGRIAPPTPARVAPLKSPRLWGGFAPIQVQLNRMPVIRHCQKRSLFFLSARHLDVNTNGFEDLLATSA
jgi:hypothetical protein